MSTLSDLTTIRDNILAEVKNETARRAALTAAGNPPPTTYSQGGKTFDWNGWVQTQLKAVADLNELIIAQDLYELHSVAYS